MILFKQIIFVVGILTGISLCIAGSVLKRRIRGGDLEVLVYIGTCGLRLYFLYRRKISRSQIKDLWMFSGGLTFLVCSLLLGVQCCVRRNNKKRSKQMRLRNAPPDCIPMETIPVRFINIIKCRIESCLFMFSHCRVLIWTKTKRRLNLKILLRDKCNLCCIRCRIKI